MEQFTPRIKTCPLPLTLSDAALRLTYLTKQFTPLTILSTATAGPSDSALMLTLCALQMFVLLLLLLLLILLPYEQVQFCENSPCSAVFVMRKEDASVTNIGFVNSNAYILLIYFKKTASS